MADGADVIVIGAGIIGATCAWRMAQAGLRVTVLERSAPGSEASQAALGVLTFHANPDVPAAYQELRQRTWELYPALIEELAEATGERVRYQAGGELIVALLEEDLAEIEATYAHNNRLGIPVERATPEECQMLQPGVTPNSYGGIFFPRDGWVDNTALTFGIVAAAERSGANFERANAQAVESRAGRATGVRCGKDTYRADWVIVAAGCWSGQIAGVPSLPVVPVRGQAFGVGGRTLRRVVTSPRGYLVPKGEGQAMVGATVETVGFDASNTLAGVHEVAAAGLEIAPALGSCEFLGAWAGLRPGTPDDLPFIGPFEALPNLVAATGHFRNGILLAPVTAELVAATVTGAATRVTLGPFSPDRSAKG